MLFIYAKMIAISLIPAVVSGILYLLLKKGRLNFVSETKQQILIGIIFGIIAVIGTEFGINIEGITINVRDAAPLCAGMIFGGPAGIIAGIIGGVERWFAVYWGAGEYSRWACTVSTILAGIIAAVIRKYLFDDRRPTIVFGCFAAAVVEVMHMTIMFITHMYEPLHAYSVIELCSVPMILSNTAAVGLALAFIKRLNGEKIFIPKEERRIEHKIRKYLLGAIVLALAISMLFSFHLDTNLTKAYVKDEMTCNLKSVSKELKNNKDVDLGVLIRNCRMGNTGKLIIADKNGDVIDSDIGYTSGSLKEAGIDIKKYGYDKDGVFSRVLDTPSYWMARPAGDYIVVMVITHENMFDKRNKNLFTNIFLEILILALLFAVMFMSTKTQVRMAFISMKDELKNLIGDNIQTKHQSGAVEEFEYIDEEIRKQIGVVADKLHEELDTARTIQMSMLPDSKSRWIEMDINAFIEPARHVGGDFYDYFRIDENRVAIMIADVSGKGLGAALFMMRARTTIRSYADRGLPVDEIINRTNTALCNDNDKGMFVTVWFGIINMETGLVQYVDAGHGCAMLKNSEQGFMQPENRPELVLAAFPGKKYKLREFTMKPGSRLYLYTDGVSEADNIEEELYGEERLKKCLNGIPDNRNGGEVLQIVRKSVSNFVKEAPQFDDITMMIVDYRGPRAKRH